MNHKSTKRRPQLRNGRLFRVLIIDGRHRNNRDRTAEQRNAAGQMLIRARSRNTATETHDEN